MPGMCAASMLYLSKRLRCTDDVHVIPFEPGSMIVQRSTTETIAVQTSMARRYPYGAFFFEWKDDIWDSDDARLIVVLSALLHELSGEEQSAVRPLSNVLTGPHFS
jgi:hypothetical protein